MWERKRREVKADWKRKRTKRKPRAKEMVTRAVYTSLHPHQPDVGAILERYPSNLARRKYILGGGNPN